MSNKRKFERAAAEAYAQIPAIESACYHYLTDNFSEHHKAALRQYFISELSAKDIKPKYIATVVDVALVELTYPAPTNGDKYLWSCRDRAATCDIPKSTWHRHNLCDYTNFVIDIIRANADRASLAIELQLHDAAWQ